MITPEMYEGPLHPQTEAEICAINRELGDDVTGRVAMLLGLFDNLVARASNDATVQWLLLTQACQVLEEAGVEHAVLVEARNRMDRAKAAIETAG